MKNSDCYLGYVGETINLETNMLVKKQVFKDVIFCEEKSIGMSEFYQASASGFKPEIKLIVNKQDYSNETLVKFNDIVYQIIRTFSPTNTDDIELVLRGYIE